MKSDMQGVQSLPDIAGPAGAAPKVRGLWQTPRIDIVAIGEVTLAKGAMVTEGSTTRNSS